MAEARSQAELRKSILERAESARVKFLRLQFTDILGVIKNVEVPDRQFEEALDGQLMFDGSSIEGFVRIEESDMYLRPDLSTFQVFPWTDPQRRAGRPAHLRHRQSGRHAVRRLPAHDAQARHRAGRRPRPDDEGRAGDRVLPVPAARRAPDHRDARRGQLLRPGAGRSRRGRPPRDRPRARADGHARRGGASRGGARPARDRLPLRRRAGDGRQREHVPLHREERGAAQQPARHLHAEADLRRRRLGDAHAPVAVRGRRQRVLRRPTPSGS